VDHYDQEALVNKAWIPLAGVLFIVLAVVGGAIAGEPPGADDPAEEIVSHYVDNDSAIMVGTLITMIGILFFLVFASYLRNLLRDAEGPGGLLANLAFAGAIILAVGGAIDGTISFALAEAAEDIDPAAVQALQALWDNDFVPFVIGAGSFLLASGLVIVRTGTLPKWLGWIAVVLGVLSFAGPIGFVGFVGGGVWILIASVMLALRARTPSAPASPAAPTPGV
jgi:Domain of unknown function (DUF4386)